jgi:6-phosphogluconolactonase
MMEIYRDHEALSAALAELFARRAREAVAARGRFDVLLSGGETPLEAYRLVGREPLRSSIPWQTVQLFWGDERHVPHNDPRSNFGQARQALLEPLSLSPDQVHIVPYAATAEQAAREYEEELRRHFGEEPVFDLVLLGLGKDGHTASLFPGSELLEEKERWVRGGGPPGQDLCRVTVTLPVLNRARLIAFVVAGDAKAEILSRVLKGTRDPQLLPAQQVDPGEGRLLWLVDRAAARLLAS